MDKNKADKFYEWMNLIFLIGMIIVFLYFISNVSISKKISPETYTIDGELDKEAWMWALGEFIAVMGGWTYLLNFFAEEAYPKAGEK